MPAADFDGALPQPGIRHGSSGVVIFEVLRERVWPLLSMERRRLVTEQLHLARVTTHMKHVSTHTLDRKALRDGGIACFILLHTIWGRAICQTRRWWSQYVQEAPELAEALPRGRIPLPEFEDRPDRTVHRARYGRPIRRSRRAGIDRAATKQNAKSGQPTANEAVAPEQATRPTGVDYRSESSARPAAGPSRSSRRIRLRVNPPAARDLRSAKGPAVCETPCDPEETEAEFINEAEHSGSEHEPSGNSKTGGAGRREPLIGVLDASHRLSRAVANTSSGEGTAETEAQLNVDRALTPDPLPISGPAYAPGGRFTPPTDPALGNGAFDVLLQTAQVASDEQYVRSLLSEHIASLQDEKHYLILSAEEYLRRVNIIAGDMADNSRITHSFVNLQRASMANFHQGVNASLDVLESKIRSIERSLAGLDNRH